MTSAVLQERGLNQRRARVNWLSTPHPCRTGGTARAAEEWKTRGVVTGVVLVEDEL